MMAGAIGSVLMLALSTLLTGTFRAVKHTELTGDFALLRNTLLDQIDCDATFKEANIDPNDPLVCNSNSSPNGQLAARRFLRLRRKTRDGSIQYVTDSLVNGVGRLGTLSLRATCSASEQSLVIRAARPVGKTFLEDPLTRRLASWDAPRALAFGGRPGDIPLCYVSETPTGPRRQASILVGMRVFNTGLETIDIDLTGPAPVIQGAGSLVGYIRSSDWTEPFSKTGKIITSASVRYSDVKTEKSNIAISPDFDISYPAQGVVRVKLNAHGDMGKPDGAQQGTVGIQLALAQY